MFIEMQDERDSVVVINTDHVVKFEKLEPDRPTGPNKWRFHYAIGDPERLFCADDLGTQIAIGGCWRPRAT
jgi:hypothetical protein